MNEPKYSVKNIRPEVLKMLEEIARKNFGTETLKTRFSDDLDFHDIHVGSILKALHTAFYCGVAEGAKMMGEINQN